MNWRHIFVFLSALLMYSNTVSHGIVLGDKHSIFQDPIIHKGFNGLQKQLAPSPDRQTSSYTPLSRISFGIEYHFWQLNPKGYHLVNILLYGILCLVLYILLMKMDWLHPDLSLILVLLFTCHPIHTEVVANINNRNELYCFLFFAIAMLDYIQYLSNKKIYFLVAPLFLMLFSMLAMETAVMLLLFFFLLAWSKTESWIKALKSSLWMITPLITYIGLSSAFVDSSVSTDLDLLGNSLLQASSWSELWATKMGLWGKYISMLIIPYPLVHDYGFNTFPMLDWVSSLVLVSLAFFVLAKGFFLYAFKKDKQLALRVYFAAALFLFPILLKSNLLFISNTVFAERFLFIPSFGFLLLVFMAIQEFLWKEHSIAARTLVIGLASVCLIFAAITWNRSADWQSNETLFTADIKHLKMNAKANYNLASIYSEKGDLSTIEGEKRTFYETAIRLLEDAIAIYPDAQFFKESALLYEATNRTDGAIKAYETYLELNPNDTEIETRLNVLKAGLSDSE